MQYLSRNEMKKVAIDREFIFYYKFINILAIAHWTNSEKSYNSHTPSLWTPTAIMIKTISDKYNTRTMRYIYKKNIAHINGKNKTHLSCVTQLEITPKQLALHTSYYFVRLEVVIFQDFWITEYGLFLNKVIWFIKFSKI